ncbi:unnamed protein product, partial [marine sediment metagenome]
MPQSKGYRFVLHDYVLTIEDLLEIDHIDRQSLVHVLGEWCKSSQVFEVTL